MPFDTFDLDATTEERHKSIEKTIRQVTIDDVKKLGDGLFKFADDPWREAFYSFLAEHPHATFYHAVTHDNVNIVYSSEGDKGIWFLPGSGLGPLQANGRRFMKEAAGRARA